MRRLSILLALALLPISGTFAQSSGKTLASSLEVYVFPKEGQTAEQQSKDEAACYEWAVGNSGIDPFDLQKQSAQQQQQAQQQAQQAQDSTRGSGARGALGGAAAGALIGEIADDDAGKGAAYGAAIGGIAARRRAHRDSAAAQQQAQTQSENVQQASAAQMGNFRNAFSVCLEAKDYLAKF